TLTLGSGVCKSRRVGPSGAVARVGVVVSLVTHQASARDLRVLGMNRPGVHGDAGLAPAVGLIRSLSARSVTHYRPAARFPCSRPAYRTLRVGGSVGMLAEQVDYVVGVDTHRDQHALAVVDAHTGAVIAQRATAATARGYQEAVGFAD